MGSGGGGTSTQYVKSETSNLPAYAQPYFTNLMERANAQLTTGYQPYQDASGNPIERIAGFTPAQQQVQQNILNQQTPGQFGTASNLAASAGLGSLSAGQYNPSMFGVQRARGPNLNYFQMQGPQDVQAQQNYAPTMQGAQTGYQPNLNYFQMQGPGSFTQPGAAAQYMSPYTQNVLDIQKQQAIRDAQQGQLAQNLGAARQGTYGGSRQLLASMERERNLGQNLANIQATGQQAAYDKAMQQFNAEQQMQQQAGQQNLQAALGVQGLGAQYGTQVALQNLSNEQQAQVQNQAAQLQQMGLNQQQALQAALANQQMGYNVGQQNLSAALQTQGLGAQYGMQAQLANQQMALDAQKAAEQSRQFGANLGLQGLAQAGQMGQTLSNIGSAQSQADLARMGMQQQTAAQEQALQQQRMTQQYQDFLNQRDWYNQQLQQYSSLLHGVPVAANTTTTESAPAPSLASQIMGTGLGALGMYKTLGG